MRLMGTQLGSLDWVIWTCQILLNVDVAGFERRGLKSVLQGFWQFAPNVCCLGKVATVLELR